MTTIETKYLTKITKLLPNSGRLAFRGHADNNWKLHSGATRRLLPKNSGKDSNYDLRPVAFGKLFSSYHRSVLLETARKYGFDMNEGHRDSEIQLISKLQHLGAATGLIDFTWDSLVALWFATAIPEGKHCPGKVIVVNLNDTRLFQKYSMPEDKQTLSSLFPMTSGPTARQFYWEPQFKGEANNRILRQRSVFLIGKPTGPEVPTNNIALEIEIAVDDKEIIRSELDSLFGVSEQSLFPDVHGFAKANSTLTDISSRLDDPEFFENQGSDLYQRGEYQSAIIAYDESIRVAPDQWRPYYLRGNAKAQNKDYSEARDDYDFALQFLRSAANASDPALKRISEFNLFMVAFNRGNMSYIMGKYEDACKYYGEGIQSCTRQEQGALRNNQANAKAKLKQFSASLEDYDIAIKCDIQYAQFNKGNALVAIGRFEEALECYLNEQQRCDFEKANNNIAIMRDVIDRIGDRQSIVTIYEQEDATFTSIPSVLVFESEEARSHYSLNYQGEPINYGKGITFICTASAGNIGNYGSGDTHGGEGFHGDTGFYLRITW